MEPLISVIIPVYNTEAYNERCIRSIQANDYPNLEIICVNDGSTDGSLAMLRKFAERDHRIRVIDKPNGGLSDARNAGLDVATGTYIAFVDSDDWIHSSFFSMLAKEAVAGDADITVAGYVDVFSEDDGRDEAPLPDRINVTHMEGKAAMTRQGYLRGKAWGRLYKRSYIGDIRFPLGVRFGEDTIFNVLAAKAAGFRVTVLDVPLYYYDQIRSDSLVHIRAWNAHYMMGSWFIDHIEDFEMKDIAVFTAFSALFIDRLENDLAPDPKLARRQNREKLNRCVKFLMRHVDCSLIWKARFIVFSKFPFVYRMALYVTAPAVIQYQKELRKNRRSTERKEVG